MQCKIFSLRYHVYQVYTKPKRFLRALCVISEYKGLVTLCCKTAVLVVLEISYQIHLQAKKCKCNL